MATGMAGIEALKGLSAGLKTRMDKAVEDFRNNLVSVRTGRASIDTAHDKVPPLPPIQPN